MNQEYKIYKITYFLMAVNVITYLYTSLKYGLSMSAMQGIQVGGFNPLYVYYYHELPYCLERNIDVMIDDSPYNVLDISSKIPVLCFHNPYNRNLNGKNIKREKIYYRYCSFDDFDNIIFLFVIFII